jgi:acetyl/propionyl-CoA carboxylase alpha subunit
MREALREVALLGIETNLQFHLRVLAEPDFLRGDFSTRYIELHPALTAETPIDEAESQAIAAAAAVHASAALGRGRPSAANFAAVSAWRRAGGWRRG